MNILAYMLVFLTAIAVACCAVLAFSTPMDDALGKVISGELAAAWSRYAKFAVFVTSFTGGLRLREIQALTPPIDAGRCLMEVFKTVVGSLEGTLWTLLAFFGAALGCYAAVQVYGHLRTGGKAARIDDRHPAANAGRY